MARRSSTGVRDHQALDLLEVRRRRRHVGEMDIPHLQARPQRLLRLAERLYEVTQMVNELLTELENAGVLDGTEKRRQLKLLDGGKR